MKTYTIGEIYRLRLLKNHKGEPYSDKATVSKELKHQPFETKKTPFGESKLFSDKVISSLNARWH
jgi:hypothetical protein